MSKETKKPITELELQAAIMKATRELVEKNRDLIVTRAKEILRASR